MRPSTTPRVRSSGALARSWLLAAVAVVPVAAMLALVASRGVDLPTWDEWVLAGRLDDLRAHWPTLEPLTRAHNEHRLFFPLSGLAIGAWLSDWNIRWQLVANVLVLALALPALLGLTRQILRRRGPLAAVFLFGTALLFHPAAIENWTWSWQLQIFLLVVAALWSLKLLAREPARTRSLSLAIAAAFVATFSFANGLLLWPLGLLVLGSWRRESWRQTAVWLAAAAASLALFFVGRTIEPKGGRADLGSILVYASTYLGSPSWGRNEGAGAAAFQGLLGLILALALVVTAGPAWQRRGWRAALALTGFGALSALLTAVGRAGLGLEQALASRYVTICSLFWIGLALLIADRWEAESVRRSERRFRRALGPITVLLALVILSGLVARVPADLQAFRGQQRHRQWVRAELDRGVLTEAAAAALYPHRDVLEVFLRLTCRDRLSVFRPYGRDLPLDCDFSAQRAAPDRQLWRLIEDPDQPRLVSERGYRIPLRAGVEGALRRPPTSAERCWAGWAWDVEHDERAGDVMVLVDGRSHTAVLRRPPRRGRAEAAGDPRLASSGLRLCLPEVPDGHVRFFALSGRGGYASELPLASGGDG